MLFRDFLGFLLDDSLEEARVRRRAPSEHMDFLGSERALTECRSVMQGDGMALRLKQLLAEAREDSASSTDDADHLFWFSREVQIEWIANVVSVALMQMRLPTIVPPTKVAAIAAARLIGALPAE